MLVTFGVGLSWASTIVNLDNTYISDVKFMKNKKTLSREEQIDCWIKYFKGEAENEQQQ